MHRPAEKRQSWATASIRAHGPPPYVPFIGARALRWAFFTAPFRPGASVNTVPCHFLSGQDTPGFSWSHQRRPAERRPSARTHDNTTEGRPPSPLPRPQLAVLDQIDARDSASIHLGRVHCDIAGRTSAAAREVRSSPSKPCPRCFHLHLSAALPPPPPRARGAQDEAACSRCTLSSSQQGVRALVDEPVPKPSMARARSTKEYAPVSCPRRRRSFAPPPVTYSPHRLDATCTASCTWSRAADRTAGASVRSRSSLYRSRGYAGSGCSTHDNTLMLCNYISLYSNTEI